MYSLGLYQNDVEEILTSLIIDNFVNEERFAKAFGSGKFRLKKWGKLKIRFHLEGLKLSDYCIKKGLEEIGDVEYLETLNALIDKKLASVSGQNIYILNKKIASYLINKGYEPELVWTTLKGRM